MFVLRESLLECSFRQSDVVLSTVCESRLCLLVILLLAPSRTIALLLCLFMFLKFLLMVLEFGSSTYLF